MNWQDRVLVVVASIVVMAAAVAWRWPASADIFWWTWR